MEMSDNQSSSVSVSVSVSLLHHDGYGEEEECFCYYPWLAWKVNVNLEMREIVEGCVVCSVWRKWVTVRLSPIYD